MVSNQQTVDMRCRIRPDGPRTMASVARRPPVCLAAQARSVTETTGVTLTGLGKGEATWQRRTSRINSGGFPPSTSAYWQFKIFPRLNLATLHTPACIFATSPQSSVVSQFPSTRAYQRTWVSVVQYTKCTVGHTHSGCHLSPIPRYLRSSHRAEPESSSVGFGFAFARLEYYHSTASHSSTVCMQI